MAAADEGIGIFVWLYFERRPVSIIFVRNSLGEGCVVIHVHLLHKISYITLFLTSTDYRKETFSLIAIRFFDHEPSFAKFHLIGASCVKVSDGQNFHCNNLLSPISLPLDLANFVAP